MKYLCLLILVGSYVSSLGYHYHKKPGCGACDYHRMQKQGTSADKCGCCPEPCCCKCVNISSTPGECHQPLDLMWILDSSDSVRDHWDDVLEFVQKIVGEFDNIGTDQLVAMSCFGDNSLNPPVTWCFNKYKGPDTSEEVKTAIGELIVKGGLTNIAEGIERALQCLMSGEDRPSVPNVCVVMTDGRSTHGTEDLPDRAEDLFDECDGNVIVIGVTDQVNETELLIIANNDIDKVFTVPNFDELKDYLDDVIEEICDDPQFEEECFCCCPPPPAVMEGPHHHHYPPYGHPYPTHPYPPRPYPTHPYPPRPYPTRPYPTQPY